MPEVSIIVPAYNSGPWLPAAIESVLAQTVDNWELILVDDGSTDDTPEICDAWTSRDPRIISLHRENGGLSAARNTGLDAASGEWISFLDADDILHPRFLERLLEVAKTTGAEIVDSRLVPFYGNHWEIPVLKDSVEKVYDARDALGLALRRRPGPHNSASAKLYRKSLWTGMGFREGTWFEDIDIFYKVWMKAGHIAYADQPLYGYRQHSASFMQRYSPRRADVLDVTARMEEWMEKNEQSLLPAARDRSLGAAFNTLLLAEGWKRGGYAEGIDALQGRCWDIIRERRREVIKGKGARPKNRIAALLSYLGPGVVKRLWRFL